MTANLYKIYKLKINKITVLMELLTKRQGAMLSFTGMPISLRLVLTVAYKFQKRK